MSEYRGVYLECAGGWNDLVRPLIDFVLDNGGTVEQVKQKFGGLRFYYSVPDNWEETDVDWVAFMHWVQEVEWQSLHVCEVTGKPGQVRTNGHWLRTLCDEEAEKQGYRGTIDGRMFY